jgi:hypothetical protein
MKECSVQGERRKVTGQLGPKEKKRGGRKLNEAISPKVERRLVTWLSLNAHKAELLEDPLPIGKAEMFIVKDESISCCPDGPTSCHEDFSEDRITKGSSSFNDHI